MNIPAVFVLLLLTLLLIRGTKESAFVNGLIVVLKASIVLLFIGIGWGFINPVNHTPLIPAVTTYTTPQGITHAYGGILGILGRRRRRLFRLHRFRCGFDRRAGSAKSEARHADWHSGVAGLFAPSSMFLFSWVLSGVATVHDFRDSRTGSFGRLRHYQIHARATSGSRNQSRSRSWPAFRRLFL